MLTPRNPFQTFQIHEYGLFCDFKYSSTPALLHLKTTLSQDEDDGGERSEFPLLAIHPLMHYSKRRAVVYHYFLSSRRFCF